MDDFSQDKLIDVKQKIIVSDNQFITLDSYQLPQYPTFGIRKFASECWVLSIAGRLVSYGSYSHIVDVIRLLISKFECCYHSETSLVYFLQSPENKNVIDQIVTLRNIDHNG